MTPPSSALHRGGRRSAAPQGLSRQAGPGRSARRRRHSLRLASQNVHSLTLQELTVLLQHWRSRHWHVVCLQETRTTSANSVALAEVAKAAGWRAYWAHAGARSPPGAAQPLPSGQRNAPHRAGVAIFVSHEALGMPRGLELEGEAWRCDAGNGGDLCCKCSL